MYICIPTSKMHKNRSITHKNKTEKPFILIGFWCVWKTYLWHSDRPVISVISNQKIRWQWKFSWNSTTIYFRIPVASPADRCLWNSSWILIRIPDGNPTVVPESWILISMKMAGPGKSVKSFLQTTNKICACQQDWFKLKIILNIYVN